MELEIDTSVSDHENENLAPVEAKMKKEEEEKTTTAAAKKQDKRSATTTAAAPTGDDLETLLQKLRSGVDATPIRVVPAQYNSRRQLSDWSVLRQVLEKETQAEWPSLVESANPSLDRALGCFMGMVVGDSVGAPLEFTAACDPGEEEEDGVVFDPHTNTIVYTGERNAFGLKRGQWTDDASMGLCLAESMLAQGGYEGGDVRVRFYLWWFFGYCNAFRHAPHRPGSVGLGGNISQSLNDVRIHYSDQPAREVPGRYDATGEDAGNGSLMRLAPVPIRYHANVEQAMNMAEESSYATHPGPDAAHCCRFVAFFVCRALHRPKEDERDARAFTHDIVEEYLQQPDATHDKLRSLLSSQPPSPKEACWDWKADAIAIEQTLQERGRNYNGYPVSAEYFGSYCQDGLAMALWALAHSSSLVDCVLKTVNMRGDADTTASIAGQLAGAFYGYQSLASDPCGKVMLKDIRQWDPIWELEVRALLLHRDGASNEKDSSDEAVGE